MTVHIKPPLQVSCSNCNSTFSINYSQFHKRYYQKNNLDYWTEQEANKNKYICSPCLKDLYRNQKWKYLELIPNPKRRQQLRIYLSKGTI